MMLSLPQLIPSKIGHILEVSVTKNFPTTTHGGGKKVGMKYTPCARVTRSCQTK